MTQCLCREWKVNQMRFTLNERQARSFGIDASPRLTSVRVRQDEIIAECRGILEKMEKAGDSEARTLAARHDALIAEFDRIDADADRLEQVEIRNAQMRPIGGDSEARGQDGFSGPEGADGELAYALRPGETFRSRIAARGNYKGDADISVGAYLRSIAIGARSEAEKRALAEGSGSAGGYTVPDILSAAMIDRLRPASTVFRAGAQAVPLLSDTTYVARVATDPVPAWRLENDPIDEGEPTFDRVTFTPRSLAVICRVSREVLEDSLNIETALPKILAASMAGELDRAVLFGSGTAPEPKGVINFAGLTANSYFGAGLLLDDLIDARTALRTANSDATAFIMHPKEEGWFGKLKYGDGTYVGKGPLADVPFLTSTKVPRSGSPATTSILAGDWSKLMVGIRSQIRIEVLKERYADRHQFGFVAHLRADVVAENDANFTVLDGIPAA
jgi:HK97 family phage major capsid protein